LARFAQYIPSRRASTSFTPGVGHLASPSATYTHHSLGGTTCSRLPTALRVPASGGGAACEARVCMGPSPRRRRVRHAHAAVCAHATAVRPLRATRTQGPGKRRSSAQTEPALESNLVVMLPASDGVYVACIDARSARAHTRHPCQSTRRAASRRPMFRSRLRHDVGLGPRAARQTGSLASAVRARSRCHG
jgi:hypothetical protein